MSPIGRFLLQMCSDSLTINLNDRTIKAYIIGLGFREDRVRTTAIFLGITLEGGS